jgi:hypothetical protein
MSSRATIGESLGRMGVSPLTTRTAPNRNGWRVRLHGAFFLEIGPYSSYSLRQGEPG